MSLNWANQGTVFHLSWMLFPLPCLIAYISLCWPLIRAAVASLSATWHYLSVIYAYYIHYVIYLVLLSAFGVISVQSDGRSGASSPPRGPLYRLLRVSMGLSSVGRGIWPCPRPYSWCIAGYPFCSVKGMANSGLRGSI